MAFQINKRLYFIGLIVIVVASFAQYFIDLGPILNALIVYGIPVVLVTILSGGSILRHAFRQNPVALKYGMGAFGLFTLLGAIAGGIIYIILAEVDPNALELLDRANPILRFPPKLAWVMVALSFLMIGPAEEYIFRGFVFGGLLGLYRKRHWLIIAFASSMLFAFVHIYYFIIYGPASLILFADIVAIGMAMSATFYFSGGNLFIPAMLHGAFDATGFIASDISPEVGIFLRQTMIWTGLIVAFLIFLQARNDKKLKRQREECEFSYNCP